MPEKPDYVHAFEWATGLNCFCFLMGNSDIWHTWSDEKPVVPPLESAEWRMAVMDGLLAKDYIITFSKRSLDGGGVYCHVNHNQHRNGSASALTPNAALCAAVLAAMEAK
jgi:hypothetical protein